MYYGVDENNELFVFVLIWECYYTRNRGSRDRGKNVGGKMYNLHKACTYDSSRNIMVKSV